MELPDLDKLSLEQLWQRVHQDKTLDLEPLRKELIKLLKQKSHLKVLTYNVLQTNDNESWQNIIRLLVEENPDIAGFQETTYDFYQLLLNNKMVINKYDFIDPGYYNQYPYDGELF